MNNSDYGVEINAAIVPSIFEDEKIVDDPRNTTSLSNGLVIGLFAVGCLFIAILVKVVCHFTLKQEKDSHHDHDLVRGTSKTSRASGVSSILELAEANSLIPPTPEPDVFFKLRQILKEVNVNRLHFPGHEGEYDFSINDLHFMGVIETTEENVVKKYHHKYSRRNMAVKILRIPLSKTEIFDLNSYVELLKKEVTTVKVISYCSNIANFYGVSLLDGEILFCMELMDWSLKELYKKVHRNGTIFPEELLGYVIVASLDALIFCKNHGIVRFDVKPTTILVNRRGTIKLCDFAGSRLHDAPLSTWIYWPPEFFLNFNANFEEHVSVWSLGISLLEASLGHLPFTNFHSIHSPNSKFIPEFIMKTNFEDVVNTHIKENYSLSLCEFLKTCLKEVEKRPKVDKLTNTVMYRLYTQTFSKEAVAKLLMRFMDFEHHHGVVSTSTKEFLKQIL